MHLMILRLTHPQLLIAIVKQRAVKSGRPAEFQLRLAQRRLLIEDDLRDIGSLLFRRRLLLIAALVHRVVASWLLLQARLAACRGLVAVTALLLLLFRRLCAR